jgi:hypothetical protein
LFRMHRDNAVTLEIRDAQILSDTVSRICTDQLNVKRNT